MENTYLYILFDTNILFSYIDNGKSYSAIKQIFNYFKHGLLVPVYSDLIILEYEVILSDTKFNLDKKTKDDVISKIKEYGIKYNPIPSTNELPDPKDRPFYDLMMQCKFDPLYLVTKNRDDFYMLKKRSIKPGRCLTILEKKFGLLKENIELEKLKQEEKEIEAEIFKIISEKDYQAIEEIANELNEEKEHIREIIENSYKIRHKLEEENIVLKDID